MKTRQTYTKDNSFTQHACKTRQDVVKQITDTVGITLDDWLLLLFESGCQLMERQISDERLRLELLTNIKYGFWSWWLWAFITDDEELLNDSRANATWAASIAENYTYFKMQMARHIRIEGEADFFIKETIQDI